MPYSHGPFIALATTAGFPRALVEDFLDQLGHGRWQDIKSPSLSMLAEYAKDQESEFNAQVAWDAHRQPDPINVGGYQRRNPINPGGYQK